MSITREELIRDDNLSLHLAGYGPMCREWEKLAMWGGGPQICQACADAAKDPAVC
jgi:hypothetical protein